MKVKYKSKTVEIIFSENSSAHFANDARYFIITDQNVDKLYPNYFNFLNDKDYFVVTPGEESKSIEVVAKAINELLEKGYNRNDYIIAFGGGVIGDLAGFIASIYKRGIKYINVPTTLIAQVDSAIGGKVGINFLDFKNQIGSFYHPELVIINHNFLNSLPEIELISGKCEVLKYGALFDKELFEDLLNNDYNLKSLVKKCVEYKIDVTIEDEYDLGYRQILNFGHTIGHAIEAKYKLPHGISIGYGMYYESKMPIIKDALKKIGLSFSNVFTNLDEYILKDKKLKNNKIMMIKLKEIGKAYLEEGDISEYFSK